MYQGWDQLRSVTAGNQSSLRIIVFFTDGAPDPFSGQFNVENTQVSWLVGPELCLQVITQTWVLAVRPTFLNLAGLYQIYGTYASPAQQYVAPTNSSYSRCPV